MKQGFVTWAQNKVIMLVCSAKVGKENTSTTAAEAGKNCKKHWTVNTILK